MHLPDKSQRRRGALMLGMAMFLNSDRPPKIPQPTIERPYYVLDEKSADDDTPIVEVLIGVKSDVRARARSVYKPKSVRSPIYTGFEMFMGDKLPNPDSQEAEDLRQRSHVTVVYTMVYNDIVERVPYLEREGGFEKETTAVRRFYEESKADLVKIFKAQGRGDLIPTIDQFERECEALLRDTQGVGNPSFDFSVKQKEIANAIFENFETEVIIGENPLVVDIGRDPISYMDLREKYDSYLNPPAQLTREQRGLLAMHYLVMHGQVWDDYAGKYEDSRFGILTPATQMLSQGESYEAIEWEMGELAENYRLKTEALNVHPLLSTLIGDGLKHLMSLTDDAYRIGLNLRNSPLQAMRIKMAEEGYYDPL
jgi:hypothetical protein